MLLISVDTLRADRLSLYGHDVDTSPNLDRWSEQAVVFEQVVAPSPWTLPSHFSLFTGLDAIRHGLNHDVGTFRPELADPSGARIELLAERLRREGFFTAAFTGGAYMHPRYGLSQGFDSYAYWPDRSRSEQELATGVDRALRFIRTRGEQPFLFFLHTYDVHDPYRARQPFFSRLFPQLERTAGSIAVSSQKGSPENGFRRVSRLAHRRGPDSSFLGPEDRRMVESFYDSGVAHADHQLGRLLRATNISGDGRRTLVVLTSDHGEALLDPDPSGASVGHMELYDHTLLVPLVMAFPDGLGAGRRVPHQVRSVDIAPTILEWLGLDPQSGLDGVSLLGTIQGRPPRIPREAWSYSAAANRGISLRYDGRYKVMFDNNAWAPDTSTEARYRVFDLNRDPRESTPSPDDDIAIWAARFRERIETAAKGFRLKLVNRGAGRLSGSIRGPMVRPVATKSHDLDCSCLRWGEMGRAAFDLPPGESFSLIFEKAFGERLKVEGQLTSGEEVSSFERTFEIRRLLGPEALAFDGTYWHRRTEDLDSISVGIVVGWSGGILEHGASPAEQDAELREQLEALG
ncbi:MAG: sulfatase, partial [Holophagales bacterium]|nr:sulfatase [Holophagales bacterium]